MANPDIVIQGIISNLERIVPIVAQAIGSELIDLTPTDTTHAVENWQTTVNGSNTSVVGSYPGHGGGVGIAEMTMAGAINSYNGKKDNFIRFDMNVHYFPYLDNGWSSQAPNGVVDPAVDAGIKVAINKLRL